MESSRIKELQKYERKRNIKEEIRDVNFDVRWQCLKKALKEHLWFFGVVVPFILVGPFILFLVMFLHTRDYMILLPLIFIIGFTIFLSWAVVQSISYYYEKELIKKKSIPQLGKIVEITNDPNTGFTTIEYEYSYGGKLYYGCFVEDEDLCKEFKIGMEIPINLLKGNPSISDVNMPKLRKLINNFKENKVETK